MVDSNYYDDADLDKHFRDLLLDSDAENEGGDTDDSQNLQVIFSSREESTSDSSSVATLDSEDSDTEKWTSDVEADTRWDFTQRHGPSNAVSMCSALIDFFQLFIDDNLLTLVETETNRYGSHKDSSSVDTNKEELKKFNALCIQMGLVKMPRLRDYWSTRPALGGRSLIRLCPGTDLSNRYALFISVTTVHQTEIDCIR
nr:similar to piggyBac-derived 2 (AGAP012114-PA) [Haemonchus contortus]